MSERLASKVEVLYRVYDGEGRVVREVVSEDPYVVNWRNIRKSLFTGAVVTVCDVTGLTQSIAMRHPAGLGTAVNIMSVLAPAGDSDFGIVVGDLEGTKDLNRCNLARHLTHSPGGFEYRAMEDLGFTTIGGNMAWVVRRLFDNKGTASVQIRESALYANLIAVDSANNLVGIRVMIGLDIPTTPITVDPGSTLEITMRMIWGVPSGWAL